MAPVRNTRVLFNSIPEGYPIPGETLVVDHSQEIDLDRVTLDAGQVLVKTLALSIDPFLRKLMAEPGKAAIDKSYELGKPIYNHGIVKVIRSENSKYPVGAHLKGRPEFVEYSILSGGQLPRWRILPEATGIPWSVYVGVAGMPGQTAYYGWKEIVHAKPGETIYVSTAGGPVGSVVVQLAKADGLKVIASAGSEDKLAFLRDIGADVVFNYKTRAVADVLKEHGPIDIYWDHVGGSTIDAAINNMNTFGRIAKIGSISSYNKPPEPVYNTEDILWKRITMRGLLVDDYVEHYEDEFYTSIPPMISQGKIKYRETVVHSLDDAPQLMLDVMKGNNPGKAVVVLAEK